MTANDDDFIRDLRALGEDTSDSSIVERELAELHASYDKLEDDPSALAQLDVLVADAAFNLREPHLVPADDETTSTITQPHGPMERWVTGAGHRLIAVVVPNPQALHRLLDVLPLVEADHRVQLLFTTPLAPGFQATAMRDDIRDLGGLFLPWQQAQHMWFDLILAASFEGIQELSGPVMVMPHGAGAVQSRTDPWDGHALSALDSRALLIDNEVVPAALVLARDEELAMLAQSCPQALPRALVAGDATFDRLLTSRVYRQDYREALRVREGQRLVVISTTWGPQSLLDALPSLFRRIAAELPIDSYRVASVLDPFIWQSHGRRQVLAWMDEARAAGLDIVEPHSGWRAPLIGADLVIGDHGSMTQYAAGLDVPVIIDTSSLVAVQTGGAVAKLARLATPLQPDDPLLSQVERAIADHVPQRYAEIPELITSRPMQAGQILRETMYRLLNLTEPSRAAPISAVPLPELVPQPISSVPRRAFSPKRTTIAAEIASGNTNYRLVHKIGGEYVLDNVALSLDSPEVPAASLVSFVDVAQAVEVVVELGIPSKDDGTFTLRTTFMCTVTDALALAREGSPDMRLALRAYLKGHHRLFELGLDFELTEINQARRKLNAQVKAYTVINPPAFRGLSAELVNVELLTSDEVETLHKSLRAQDQFDASRAELQQQREWEREDVHEQRAREQESTRQNWEAEREDRRETLRLQAQRLELEREGDLRRDEWEDKNRQLEANLAIIKELAKSGFLDTANVNLEKVVNKILSGDRDQIEPGESKGSELPAKSAVSTDKDLGDDIESRQGDVE